MGIEIDGLKRVSRKLEKLGDHDYIEKAVMSSLGVTAEEIRTRAIDLLDKKVYSKAPPPGYNRTGYLKKINVARIENGYKVYALMDYAVYVEFGTGTKGDPSVPHTTKACWHIKLKNGDVKEDWRTVTGMPPRPFLHPAFNEQKSKCVKRIKATLQKRLNELTGDGGESDG